MKTGVYPRGKNFLRRLANLLNGAVNPRYAGRDDLPGLCLAHLGFPTDAQRRILHAEVHPNEAAHLRIASGQPRYRTVDNRSAAHPSRTFATIPIAPAGTRCRPAACPDTFVFSCCLPRIWFIQAEQFAQELIGNFVLRVPFGDPPTGVGLKRKTPTMVAPVSDKVH
jgi:hypothetical protein